MDIVIEAVETEPKQLRLTAAPAQIEVIYDLGRLAKEVVYDVSVRRVEDEIFLNGFLDFTLRYTCARCLTEYDEENRQPLDLILQLVPEEQVPTEEQDEFILVASNKKTYNLASHVRDVITLGLPLKPICREDCQGLCSQCGTNLNENNCDCHKERIDPRWDALKRISG
jgi:uncharacterized protein